MKYVDSMPAAENDDVTRWFAVYTAPKHEKRVAENIMTRNLEAFLPLYRASRHWKKRPPVTLELPLFPSYLFVRAAYRERGQILSSPGVLSIVGNGRHAVSIPDREIDALRSGIEQYHTEPHSYIAVGEKVNIISGPFAGFTGTLLRHRTGDRVVLTIDAIMQGVAVEIDSSYLVPMTSELETVMPSKAPSVM